MPLGTFRCGVAIGLFVGCYTPDFPENQPCTPDQRCPPGLTCDVATNECVSETPPVAHFEQLAASHRHVCGIDLDGALWCWGTNSEGQLGTGDRDHRLVPTRVGEDSDWIAIAAGDNLTCGLRAPDQLWCWGDPVFDGDYGNRPTQTPGSYKSINAGHDAWCAIDTNDMLVCHRRGGVAEPEPFPGPVKQVSTMHDTTCAIDFDDKLWCWGANNSGQVGDGSNVGEVFASSPNPISTGTFLQVDMGEDHVCAVQSDGTILCWGQCGRGQLGRGEDCFTPGIADNGRYTQVSAGNGHTCALSGGKMFCFGENNTGALGRRGGIATVDAIEVEGFDQWTSVQAGNGFTCGLRADNEAWCWGANDRGQLGDGNGGIVLEPVLADPGPFDTVAVGDQTGCAIGSDGTLWCWGSNSFGQLGDGTTFQRRRPIQIGTDTDWLHVATSRTTTCGIRAPGTLWCWGNNLDSQVGIGGTPREVHVPTQVGTATDWTDVAVGIDNGCGIKAGTLFCWGRNADSGMPASEGAMITSLDAFNDLYAAVLANGQAIVFNLQGNPVDEISSPLVTDWTTIDRGISHQCGLRGDQLWCFGQNAQGQLGTGNFDPQPDEAVQVEGLETWAHVSAGTDATCAITTDGRLACFGTEALIANGDNDAQPSPRFVGDARWKAVSVGADAACGVQVDGGLYCWGLGNSSSRGDGRGGFERPTRVTPP